MPMQSPEQSHAVKWQLLQVEKVFFWVIWYELYVLGNCFFQMQLMLSIESFLPWLWSEIIITMNFLQSYLQKQYRCKTEKQKQDKLPIVSLHCQTNAVDFNKYDNPAYCQLEQQPCRNFSPSQRTSWLLKLSESLLLHSPSKAASCNFTYSVPVPDSFPSQTRKWDSLWTW